MSTNSLKLNGDKTELLVIRSPQQCSKASNATPNVADNIIGLSEREKTWGFSLTGISNLKSHVGMICQSVKYHLHNISLARRFLTKDLTEKAIHAFKT